VYPAPFEYVAASSWEEAVEALTRHGEDARVLAGGQSLVPMMSLRLAKPSVLVDVNHAAEARIGTSNGTVEISALTRHAQLERSPVLASSCPLLPEAAAMIGNVRVRHRGTLGGSLAHADPAGELPCVAVATGAAVHVLGPKGERTIAAGDLFQSYFTTALEPDEVITGASIPLVPTGRGSAFVELARRTGDFASVMVAAVVDVDEAGERWTGVRGALGSVSDRPVDVSEVLLAFAGEWAGAAAAAEAGRRVAESVEARDDERAGAPYRRRMIEVLTARALESATARARATRET
jgi:aerobic carbon-monoxide dehydrogenase medium subunit